MTIRNDIQARPVRTVEKLWMTRKGAADYLGVSVDFIKSLEENEGLNSSKVRGLVFIAKSDIDRIIKKNFWKPYKT